MYSMCATGGRTASERENLLPSPNFGKICPMSCTLLQHSQGRVVPVVYAVLPLVAVVLNGRLTRPRLRPLK